MVTGSMVDPRGPEVDRRYPFTARLPLAGYPLAAGRHEIRAVFVENSMRCVDVRIGAGRTSAVRIA
jgi:hypothetical protein